MPWTVEDVDRHKKGLRAAQKRLWVEVANSTLERELKRGTRRAVAEGRCEAYPPEASCPDPSPVGAPPPLRFYQVVSACGPDGLEEGPF